MTRFRRGWMRHGTRQFWWKKTANILYLEKEIEDTQENIDNTKDQEEVLRREFQVHRQHAEDIKAYNAKRLAELAEPTWRRQDLLFKVVPSLDVETRSVEKRRKRSYKRCERLVHHAQQYEDAHVIFLSKFVSKIVRLQAGRHAACNVGFQCIICFLILTPGRVIINNNQGAPASIIILIQAHPFTLSQHAFLSVKLWADYEKMKKDMRAKIADMERREEEKAQEIEDLEVVITAKEDLLQQLKDKRERVAWTRIRRWGIAEYDGRFCCCSVLS